MIDPHDKNDPDCQCEWCDPDNGDVSVYGYDGDC